MSIGKLRYFFSSFILLTVLFLSAQTPANLEELRSYIQEARLMGYTNEEILTLAEENGVSGDELEILKLQLEADGKIEEPEQKRTRISGDIVRAQFDRETVPGKIFGMDLFGANSNISFQTAGMPTPANYHLGPGDQLFIDIYGKSEKYYEATVSPDGVVTLTNIGPVYVNGLSIDQATAKIKGRLSKIYTGISGSNPTTFVSVALGNVRSISVSIVGEVAAPGTYQLNGLSTVFNALYVSGGPTEMGTFREIKVFRNSKLVSSVDLYDFLLNGQSLSNVRLLNNDIIMVQPFTRQVEISGEVKRPGRYELKESERFSDLVRYAGGFTDVAYRAKVNVIRNTSTGKRVSDIFPEQFDIFSIEGGDVYKVDRIQNRFENRVLIKGAVFRPGSYAITEGLTLSQLIERADGLRGDAFLQRALITRSAEDYSTTTISLSLESLLSDRIKDPVLQREDVVEILSIYDFKEERFVRISGAVNSQGVFRYSEEMSVQDLIFLAKGLSRSAQEGTIEISRRPENQSWENQTEVLRLTVDRDLVVEDSEETLLQPFDHVIVRRNPNYFEERIVEVAGQVNYPGQYSLQNEKERVSDVILRAGGLNKNGYAPGATLIRKTEFFEEERQLLERRDNLLSVIDGIDSIIYSESDRFVIDKIIEELDNTYSDDQSDNSNLASTAKRERLEELAERSIYLNDIKIRESESIALDLEKILANPGSPEDLILEDGDIINIPKKLAMVRMRGKVLYPNTVRFESGRSAKYYINKAGGFDSRAKKSRTYVVYANGDVSRTKSFLFFRSYPKTAPGSEIIVPAKPPKAPIRATDAIAITTGLATIAALIIPLTTK